MPEACRSVRLFAVALGLSMLSGCGPVLYTVHSNAAEEKLKQARDANARWFAPFEYYFAEAHLQQAEVEAAEAEYEDAIKDAETAEEYSVRALSITRRKRLAEH